MLEEWDGRVVFGHLRLFDCSEFLANVRFTNTSISLPKRLIVKRSQLAKNQKTSLGGIKSSAVAATACRKVIPKSSTKAAVSIVT